MLHLALETSAFLLLFLEFVPGKELFYFVHEAPSRRHDDVNATPDLAPVNTPPVPDMLSSLEPPKLLSHARLRLIASMFAQVCEAVAACHDALIFHRDVKPENLIVTDGWARNQDGIHQRKVIVKLRGFSMSTRDTVSDLRRGSVPYMSYGMLFPPSLFWTLS